MFVILDLAAYLRSEDEIIIKSQIKRGFKIYKNGKLEKDYNNVVMRRSVGFKKAKDSPLHFCS